MAGNLTRDDVLANHGAFDGRGGTNLAILGSEFDRRRRAQYHQGAMAEAQQAQGQSYGPNPVAAEVGTNIRNEMDAAGPWGGFSGRMGAQAEEAEATGKRFAPVMPGGGGAGMPATGGRGTGGGGGLAALQALAGRGGGGTGAQDPRVQNLITQRMIESLETPQHQVGQVNQLGGPTDVLTGTAPTEGDRRNSAGVDAAQKAWDSDWTAQHVTEPGNIRAAHNAAQVSDIKYDNDMDQFMQPKSFMKRADDLGSKMILLNTQGDINTRIAGEKNEMDGAANAAKLKGDKIQAASGGLRALTDLANQYIEQHMPIPKSLQAAIGAVTSQIDGSADQPPAAVEPPSPLAKWIQGDHWDQMPPAGPANVRRPPVRRY